MASMIFSGVASGCLYRASVLQCLVLGSESKARRTEPSKDSVPCRKNNPSISLLLVELGQQLLAENV